MFCKYRDVFGRPGQGVHSVRLFGLAALDVLGTVLGAWLLAQGFGWDPVRTILAAFALGILLHRLFCVDTALNVRLFGEVAVRDA